MNCRERVICTFRFEKTDRALCDLMENKFPDQLLAYYRNERGLTAEEQMLQELGADCRWINTTARQMDAEFIAKVFGGKIAFYGGIDVQELLTKGTPEYVRREVRRNIRAFEECGGYIVANSHNGTDDIRSENIVAMCREVRGVR